MHASDEISELFNLDNTFRDEEVRKGKLGHRKVDWIRQLEIIVSDIKVLKNEVSCPF